ncbi:hypothetical protein [Streptomyces sp. NPDC058847]|uniref:hypothetical protein n=1 Tax=Streptomyces sp. NPDC058847 TaxID=3346649 RepID=UPI0036781F27
MTDPYETWKAQDIRRPLDVPGATPLRWQMEREAEHEARLMNNRLTLDYPHPVERGTAADALAVIALRESIRRDMENGRGVRVREALELGATWSEVAAALDVAPDEARELLRAWAGLQHQLHRNDVADGRERPLGIDDQEHAAVLALTELGDDGEAPAPAAEEPRPTVRPESARYAEELRSNPGKASADGHTGWECGTGASLIVDAMTPGPGKLGTMHAAIYACPEHQAAAEEKILRAGYGPEVRQAPPGHRWDPWPCGHVTSYRTAALVALAATQAEAQR